VNLKDIFKFQFKRVNPFPGLAIDADTWRDAHNYNRDQQRLHNLIFHQTGILEGLEVTSYQPQDLSVNIHPGVAVDPEGNIVIVRNVYHYQIQSRDSKTIYLILQFREVLDGPYQPPEGGQPTRIIDGYRIQERDNLPDEPYIELARIELDRAKGVIKDAENKLKPMKNEIDLNFRKEVTKPSKPATSGESGVLTPEIIQPKRRIVLGYALADGTKRGLHIRGLRNLAREIEMRYNWTVELEENIAFDKSITQYAMIYLTGGETFKLTEKQQSALDVFLKSSGLLVAEDCSDGEMKNTRSNKFNPVYKELTDKFKLELKAVNRNDPLLSNFNVFSEVPHGVKSGIFLKGEGIIYTDNDYGCAWEGGHESKPMSREAIRSAFEIGMNIVDYAYNMKTSVWKRKPVDSYYIQDLENAEHFGRTSRA
jgi:hypothetical protein